jgi:hypothetical protein
MSAAQTLQRDPMALPEVSTKVARRDRFNLPKTLVDTLASRVRPT